MAVLEALFEDGPTDELEYLVTRGDTTRGDGSRSILEVIFGRDERIPVGGRSVRQAGSRSNVRAAV
jgi:hypothetical protein